MCFGLAVRLIAAIAVFLVLPNGESLALDNPPYLNPELRLEKRVADPVSRMILEEKGRSVEGD